MSSRDAKKLRRVYAFVCDALDKSDFAEPGVLPSGRSLGTILGVSDSTVLKAVRLLKKDGRLVSPPDRRAAFPYSQWNDQAAPAGSASFLPLRATKSLTLQRRIQRDILNGRFRHDTPLPSEKELAARYGVSRATLHKSLLALADQELLSVKGARYLPVSLAPSPHLHAPRIVLLGEGINIGMNITWGYWHQENLKLLEMECARARIGLDVVCFQRTDAGPRIIDARTWLPFDVGDRTGVAGYVYLVTGADSVDDELLRAVAASKLPVAIFDELGTWPEPAFVKQHPNVRVFRNTVTTQPALHVGRFVLELGHRTAVFITSDNRLGYSRRRLAGLRHAFSTVNGRIVIPAVERGARSQLRVDINAAADFHARWVKGLPIAYEAPITSHFDLLTSIVETGKTRDDLWPFFRAALLVKDATVWIAVNDLCADAARDFLNENKIAVPGKISIISFDDLPVAVNKGISSYNFNHPAAMIAMLRFITNPRLFPASRPVVEIEGWVVPRTTTAPNRTARANP